MIERLSSHNRGGLRQTDTRPSPRRLSDRFAMAPDPKKNRTDHRTSVTCLEADSGIVSGRERLLKHRRWIIDLLGRGEGDALLARQIEHLLYRFA